MCTIRPSYTIVNTIFGWLYIEVATREAGAV